MRKAVGGLINYNNMTIQETIDWLKATRIKKGFSQRDTAEFIGKNKQAIAHWEEGISTPNVHDFVQWCYLFGVEVHFTIKSEAK